MFQCQMLYCCITNNSKTSELKTTSMCYFLCGLINGSTSYGIGWASGMAGDSKITFFTRLAICARSWLGAQVRLLVEGLGFLSCQPLYEPLWAFSQYDGWVSRSIPYKKTKTEDHSRCNHHVHHILLVKTGHQASQNSPVNGRNGKTTLQKGMWDGRKCNSKLWKHIYHSQENVFITFPFAAY